MTEIFRARIDHPSAWTRQSLGGKAGMMRVMTGREIAAIDALLLRTRSTPPQQVTRAAFDHPDLNPLLAEVFDVIMDGRGAIVIAGLPAQRYTPEEMERIYWGFGTHWGDAVTQSAQGDRLGRVSADPANPKNRAYRTTEELYLHTDANEIVGLMCIQRAASGGTTRLASTAAIHNEILARRPDLLAPLYEGYYYASRETAGSAQPITPYKIPVYCYVDGKVSCRYNGEFIERAGAMNGGLPADLDEALKLFHAIGAEIQLDFMLEPGEIMILNNFATLHARTQFEDSPERKRSLLRLWLDLPNGRKVVPMYRRQAMTYDENDKRLAETAAV